MVGRLIAILLCVALSACSGPLRTYSGSARPPSEVAIIENPDRDILVRTLDGVYLNYRCPVEILPGPHKVFVSYWAHSGVDGFVFSAAYPFDFEAEAGHTYLLQTVVRGQDWCAKLTDKDHTHRSWGCL